MVQFTLNGSPVSVDVDADTPLLWVIRENLKLTGSKFGCGIGQCGACTMHVDGQAMRTCILPVVAVEGREVTTIEGLSENGDHPLQVAWVHNAVPQCGYCQSGQIMNAAAFLAQNPSPDDAAIEQAMSGNICRCGTYQQIRQAIKEAATSAPTVGHFDPATGGEA